MATRTPKRMAGPLQLATGGAATVYTVPTTRLYAIVRHIHVYNPIATGRSFSMSIGADAAGTRLFDLFLIFQQTVFDHYCYYVLAPGEIVQAQDASGAAGLVLTMDGDEYS